MKNNADHQPVTATLDKLTSKKVITTSIIAGVTVLILVTVVTQSVTLLSLILGFLFLYASVYFLKYLAKKLRSATEICDDSEAEASSGQDEESGGDGEEDEEVQQTVGETTV